MQQLKLVSDTKKVTKAEVAKLANSIRSGEVPATTTYKVKKYFKDNGFGIDVPDMNKRYQARGFEINHDFCDERATYIKNTGDYSELNPAVLVKMSNGQVILVDGNHGTDICLRVGKETHDAIVLDFLEDLGGDMDNLYRFANLMNNPIGVKQPLDVEDIKQEIYSVVEGREERNENPEFTEEDYSDFLLAYPQITKGTIVQWLTNHAQFGGRRDPSHVWSSEEREAIWFSYANNPDYEDYCVLKPRTFHSWNGESIAAIFTECLNANKSKAYVILYPNTHASETRMRKARASGNVQILYNRLAERFGLDDIKAHFLLEK